MLTARRHSRLGSPNLPPLVVLPTSVWGRRVGNPLDCNERGITGIPFVRRPLRLRHRYGNPLARLQHDSPFLTFLLEINVWPDAQYDFRVRAINAEGCGHFRNDARNSRLYMAVAFADDSGFGLLFDGSISRIGIDKALRVC